MSVIINLGTIVLPKYATLSEQPQPQVAKNYTLAGGLVVDYKSTRRIWTVTWNWLLKADYDAIRAEFDRQFSQATMLAFSMSGDLALSARLAYLDMPDPRQIKFSGQWVKDLTITIEEQSAYASS